MPFTSMVTAPTGGGGPQGVETKSGDADSAADAGRRRLTAADDESDDGSTASSREELEATVATLEADRDRLLAERRELRTRYEQLLRELERRERRDEQRPTTRSTPPADDGLLLRVARRLGLR